MQVSASVSAKCGFEEQEQASRASAFAMAALFLMRTWSMDASVWVIGLGVSILPRSRLWVQSLGFETVVLVVLVVLLVRGETEESEGEDWTVEGKFWKGSNTGSLEGARLGTRLELRLLLSSPKMNWLLG
jgi:hypothetical protein